MSQFVLAIFSGLTLGATYALVALGLVLVFRTTGIFNLAHGQLMLLAAYVVADWQARHHGSFFPGAVFGLLAAAVVAVMFYVVFLRRMVGLPHWVPFVATLIAGTVMDALFQIKYGGSEYAIKIPGMPSGAVSIFGARIGKASLVVGVIGLVMAVAIIVVLQVTRLGVHVRAAGQDSLLAAQGGIQVRWLYIGSWAAAGILAGIAGILYGSSGTVDSSLTQVAFLAIPVMVLGGLDSFVGAVVAGLVVGIVQELVTLWWSNQYVDVTTYSLLLLVLLIYPRGLFGTADVVKV